MDMTRDPYNGAAQFINGNGGVIANFTVHLIKTLPSKERRGSWKGTLTLNATGWTDDLEAGPVVLRLATGRSAPATLTSVPANRAQRTAELVGSGPPPF